MLETETFQTMISFENDLFKAGFDICHSFPPYLYNKYIDKHSLPLKPLPSEDTCMGYLIGNTKHMWPIFIKWYNSSEEKLVNPLDAYCKRNIDDILKINFIPSTSYQVFWSSESCANKLVSMQRVASCSGLSYLDSKSHLTIHPVYGSWHSFRAVVIVQTKDISFIGSSSISIKSITLPCLLTHKEEEDAQAALRQALKLSDENRLCEQLHGKGSSEQVAAAWIVVRDCVSRGKEFRFGDNQLWYHYTNDTKYLQQ